LQAPKIQTSKLTQCKAHWTAPVLKDTRCTLGKYIRLTKNTSPDCVTDEA
jgi:hypothetical protein